MVDIEERIDVLFEQKSSCPMCSSEADLTVFEYRSPYEVIVITTIKCSYCGYRRSDILPIIEEDENKCLEVKVEYPQDLNTLLFVPPGSSIELPELKIKIEFAEFADTSMGNYVTVEAILHYITELYENTCSQIMLELGPSKCEYALNIFKQTLKDVSAHITVRITNNYGNIRVVKTYRKNFENCNYT
ncbi:MAG: hypothetical protein QXL96_08860 [Ignisphaera sp.]